MQNAKRGVRLLFGFLCDSLRLGDSEYREREVIGKSEIGGLKFGRWSWGRTSAHTTSQLCPPWPISCSLCPGHLGQGWHSELLNNNWKWYNYKRRGVSTSGSHCNLFPIYESQETQHEATENEEYQSIHGAVRAPCSVKSWGPKSVLATIHLSVLGSSQSMSEASWVGTSDLGMGEKPR